ncbi:hypothetical protein LJC58_01190 [Lachnospiraceae bacterium OttesenSCG-928-D06]|nr:hypothetical protein [Lachnospiraceae bacterium OttesenSCG-928-D06]
MVRIKSFALCLLLSLTVTSCAPSREETRPISENSQNFSFEKHLDISIGYWNIDGMAKATQPDPLTEYIESLFNITIHPVPVTWSNYKERYQILSATDSLPDVFATVTISSNDNNDSSTFIEMIETGSIRALPVDLSPWPSIETLMESVSYTKYSDGCFYALPRFSFTDASLGSTDAAMLVRRDWMETLGLSDPQSFQEFADLAAAFANHDPDGNGIHDTIGYNVNSLNALGKWVILGIDPPSNVYSWIEKDGLFIPSWTTENFKDVIVAYRELYTSGGLDPAFYSKSPTIVIDDFASGRLGLLEYKSSPSSLMEIKQKWDAINDKPFEECVDVLPIFPTKQGIRYSNSSNVFWSESFISSSADDEKVERILSLFEFLLSEEGIRMGSYGLEGIDYVKQEDGTYECLLNTEGEGLATVLCRKYPSIAMFNAIASWGGGWEDFEVNELNNLRYGKACVELGRKSALWNQANTVPLTRSYAFLLTPKESTDIFSTANALEAMINCIIGTEDPIIMWDNYLNQLYDNGFSDYIQRQNDSYFENQVKKERD